MRSGKGKLLLKVVAGAVCVTAIAGCSLVDFPRKLEFSVTWVSTEGKTKEQLDEDQRACTREAMLANTPAFPGEMGGGGGGDMKVFDRCMRSKGWVKE